MSEASSQQKLEYVKSIKMKGSILNKTIVHFFTNFRNNSIKKNPSNFVNRPKKKTSIRHDKIR